MNKVIIVSLTVLGFSTSAAMAAKHHAKKHAATTAAMNPSGPTNPSPFGGPMAFGATSSADHEMYLRNKRESGVK